MNLEEAPVTQELWCQCEDLFRASKFILQSEINEFIHEVGKG